jgi:hypothetical protein
MIELTEDERDSIVSWKSRIHNKLSDAQTKSLRVQIEDVQKDLVEVKGEVMALELLRTKIRDALEDNNSLELQRQSTRVEKDLDDKKKEVVGIQSLYTTLRTTQVNQASKPVAMDGLKTVKVIEYYNFLQGMLYLRNHLQGGLNVGRESELCKRFWHDCGNPLLISGEASSMKAREEANIDGWDAARVIYTKWMGGDPEYQVLNKKLAELKRKGVEEKTDRTRKVQQLVELREISDMGLITEVVHEHAVRDAILDTAAHWGKIKTWMTSKNSKHWTTMPWEEFHKDMVELAMRSDSEVRGKRSSSYEQHERNNRLLEKQLPGKRKSGERGATMVIDDEDIESYKNTACVCGKRSYQKHHFLDCEVMKVCGDKEREATELFWKMREAKNKRSRD